MPLDIADQVTALHFGREYQRVTNDALVPDRLCGESAVRFEHELGCECLLRRPTLEITGPRKRAKPAVAGPVHRRVGRHRAYAQYSSDNPCTLVPSTATWNVGAWPDVCRGK